MTTPVEDIIQQAFRSANITPVGTQPTTAQQTEALARLNTIVKNVLGYELGEPLSDWTAPYPQRTSPVQANFPQLPYDQTFDLSVLSSPATNTTVNQTVWQNPPQNTRIVFGGVTGTVYFPAAPDDGAQMALVQGSGAGDGGVPGAILTLNGNGRTIEGANTQTETDPVTEKRWLYRADIADWVALATLELADEMPFSEDVDDFWITRLCIRLCPEYGKSASPELANAYKVAKAQFLAKYKQSGVTTYGSGQIPRSWQSYMPTGPDGWWP